VKTLNFGEEDALLNKMRIKIYDNRRNNAAITIQRLVRMKRGMTQFKQLVIDKLLIIE
jgi:hypothetical protein